MVADALTMGFRAVHPRVQRKQLQESLLEQTELELQKRLGIHRRGALRRAEAVVGCVVRVPFGMAKWKVMPSRLRSPTQEGHNSSTHISPRALTISL